MAEEQGVIPRTTRAERLRSQNDLLFGTSDFQTEDAARAIQDEVTYKFNSFSGADIYAMANIFDPSAEKGEEHKQLILGNIQTLTFSTHREKFPARALGHVGARGYTRGPRTIGGTMIFTVFDHGVLTELMQLNHLIEASASDSGRGKSAGIHQIILVDQIPPFDISILFANETGSISKMAIYGVELVNEGQTMSIEDLITESVVSYVARHIDPMTSLLEPGERVRLDGLGEGVQVATGNILDPSESNLVTWKALTKDTSIKAALDEMK